VIVESDSRLGTWWHVATRVLWPRWSAELAGWPTPLQHLVLAVLAAIAVLIWWPTLRRPVAGQRRWLPVPVGLVVVALLAMAVRHHIGWQGTDAWALAFSLPVGVAMGASLPLAVRRLRRQRSPVTIWDRLNEEFISYTHTGWCKNLETLIRQGTMLAGDLPSGDHEALTARWRAAREHYDRAVADKLRTIAELGFALEDTQPAARDLATGLRRLQRASDHGPEAIAAGARELRQTVDRIAAIVETRLSCRADEAARTAVHAMQPEFEAQGVALVMDMEPIAGLSVRIREHELVMVIQDLLRNAAEAASVAPAPRIRLQARADIRRVELSIRDNGPGLEGRDPDHLCEAGVTTKRSGSGFGLYHARQRLGVYRGVLRLADHPDGGLEVVLSLQRPLHARTDQARSSR
jgi:signal transduction histidine kinase